MKRILNSLVICFLIAPLSFSQDIKLSGQVSVENNQIKNVGDPTDPQDAVTLNYLGLAPTTNEVIILDDFTNRVPTGTSYEDLKYYNKYSDLESTDGTTFEINRLTTENSGGILFYGTLELNSQKNANIFRVSDSSGMRFNLNSFDLKDLEEYGARDMENFSGSADPGQTVEIYINGTLFSSVVADSNGEWIVEFDGLPSGSSDISINGGYINGPSLIVSSSDGEEVSFRTEIDRIYVDVYGDEYYVDFSFGYTQNLGVQELSWENVEWVDFTSRYTKAKITHLNLGQGKAKEPFSGSYNDLTDKPDLNNQLLSLTSSHTLTDSDNRKVITFNSSNDVDLSFPGTLSSGFNCIIVQLGTGHVNFVSSGGTILVGGTNLISKQNVARTSGQGAVVNIINVGTENFVLSGDTGVKLPPQAPYVFWQNYTNNKKPEITLYDVDGGSIKIYGDDNTDITDNFTVVEDSSSYTLTPKQDLSDGVYNYSISFDDLFGNTIKTFSVSFTIDTVAPVVSLNGGQYINVEIGGTYNEQGASSDGGETISISGDTVNTSSVGTYVVTYNATDLAGNSSSANRTVTVYKSSFTYTASVQTFIVPPGVTSISVDAYGASSSVSSGIYGYCGGYQAKGGRVQTDLSVSAGETLYVYVGGMSVTCYGGNDCTPSGGQAGGWNGGGKGSGTSEAGGGATDIRSGGQSHENRIIVAGGAGGAGASCQSNGGHGGGLIANDGGYDSSGSGSAKRGRGGSQTSGGLGGSWHGGSPKAGNGAFGVGGNGNSVSGSSGGGGGGGWYGGGGAVNGDAGGGGGSSYTHPTRCSSVEHTKGVQTGHGKLIIRLNSAE